MRLGFPLRRKAPADAAAPLETAPSAAEAVDPREAARAALAGRVMDAAARDEVLEEARGGVAGRSEAGGMSLAQTETVRTAGMDSDHAEAEATYGKIATQVAYSVLRAHENYERGADGYPARARELAEQLGGLFEPMEKDRQIIECIGFLRNGAVAEEVYRLARKFADGDELPARQAAPLPPAFLAASRQAPGVTLPAAAEASVQQSVARRPLPAGLAAAQRSVAAMVPAAPVVEAPVHGLPDPIEEMSERVGLVAGAAVPAHGSTVGAPTFNFDAKTPGVGEISDAPVLYPEEGNAPVASTIAAYGSEDASAGDPAYGDPLDGPSAVDEEAQLQQEHGVLAAQAGAEFRRLVAAVEGRDEGKSEEELAFSLNMDPEVFRLGEYIVTSALAVRAFMEAMNAFDLDAYREVLCPDGEGPGEAAALDSLFDVLESVRHLLNVATEEGLGRVSGWGPEALMGRAGDASLPEVGVEEDRPVLAPPSGDELAEAAGAFAARSHQDEAYAAGAAFGASPEDEMAAIGGGMPVSEEGPSDGSFDGLAEEQPRAPVAVGGFSDDAPMMAVIPPAPAEHAEQVEDLDTVRAFFGEAVEIEAAVPPPPPAMFVASDAPLVARMLTRARDTMEWAFAPMPGSKASPLATLSASIAVEPGTVTGIAYHAQADIAVRVRGPGLLMLGKVLPVVVDRPLGIRFGKADEPPVVLASPDEAMLQSLGIEDLAAIAEACAAGQLRVPEDGTGEAQPFRLSGPGGKVLLRLFVVPVTSGGAYAEKFRFSEADARTFKHAVERGCAAARASAVVGSVEWTMVGPDMLRNEVRDIWRRQPTWLGRMGQAIESLVDALPAEAVA